MIVVDTDVASEMMKPTPAPEVWAWVKAQRGSEFGTTAVTVAEIRYSIERLPVGARRRELNSAAERFLAEFADSILPFDTSAADHYARIVVGGERAGKTIPHLDAQIAAICRAHDVPLATRNVRDLRATGVRLIDPWKQKK